ncbi:BN159_2729 family protein [Streptomyces sp. NBC_01476]|uniref:BN159_2729 family protein n=1 Tax=Streptomyces sp. NBC_01476 TaxID=2903881 RepID=UPI002E360B02|nr:BN159_2729 family protein [Streptomyces sp. NBC_01476]
MSTSPPNRLMPGIPFRRRTRAAREDAAPAAPAPPAVSVPKWAGAAGRTQTDAPPAAPAAPAAPVTLPTPAPAPEDGVEDVARAWERSCRRSLRAEKQLAAAWAAHPEVLTVSADRDRVLVALRVIDLHAWYVWRSALGIRGRRVIFIGPDCAGLGAVEGAAVRLVGLGVPGLLAGREATAAHPYRLWDGVYDLARPLVDDRGNTWTHEDVWSYDGVPLLSLTGTALPSACTAPWPCLLTDLVEQCGPLVAAHPPTGRPAASRVPVPPR